MFHPPRVLFNLGPIFFFLRFYKEKSLKKIYATSSANIRKIQPAFHQKQFNKNKTQNFLRIIHASSCIKLFSFRLNKKYTIKKKKLLLVIFQLSAILKFPLLVFVTRVSFMTCFKNKK